MLLLCTRGACVADVLDGFDDASRWSLILADGVQGQIVEVDGALRLDYDFTAGAGYCVLRRDVDLTLGANYRFSLRYRGEGAPNTLEFKLIDPSGENVWWSVERDFEFPHDWQTRSMRARHFSFAWGPSGGEVLDELGAIEIAVTASGGGKGSVWLDELAYEPLPEIESKPVEALVVNARGERLGRVEANGAFGWDGRSGDSVDFVFDTPVEFSGIELGWADGISPVSYTVESSLDGVHFDQLSVVRDSDGKHDAIFAPESEARVVRLMLQEGPATLEQIRFVPVERWSDANTYFDDLAGQSSRRGAYPRYFGSLTPWTVLGLPEHPHEALMSVTGAIEPIKSGYSLEPFVLRGERLETWANATLAQSLDSGSLPIPTVQWALDGIELGITSIASDLSGQDRLHVRYTLTNTGEKPEVVSLVLAARPFQVLPAAQFLNTIGGAVDADSVVVTPELVRVDDQAFLVSDTQADAVLTAHSASGDLCDRIMDESRWHDDAISAQGSFPSAAMRFDRELDPGETYTLDVSLPMSVSGLAGKEVAFESVLAHERARWSGLLEHTEIMVPASHAALRDTIRANMAYILINADGAGVRPGSRSYERSWIRDGAMTSAALIALGRQDDARAFIEWYSGYQYSDGKVPCVVDSRGPDPVDEHDAPGEFIFAIRNAAEAGGEFDEAFARSMFPGVLAAVEYIERMRRTRLSEAYSGSSDPIMRACTGLMPESISHEGYSAKPMHSYWDDFWIYRGLWDAVDLAEQLGEIEHAERLRSIAMDFEQSLAASVALASRAHGIDYVPGCVELGDFDATSTSIAYYPTGAARVLDEGMLSATFERAWEETKRRIDGGAWDAMTPYEVRTVGTFVRLGWVDRAHEYLDWLMGLQAPEGWHQWGEIAYCTEAPCRFVGDIPHTWVGSGAVLSIMSMFAYEREGALVLGAGIPSDWLGRDEPLGVRNLVTRFGELSYTLQKSDDGIVLRIEPGCEPSGGYQVELAEICEALNRQDAASLSIQVDGVETAPSDFASLRLPPKTRVVVFR